MIHLCLLRDTLYKLECQGNENPLFVDCSSLNSIYKLSQVTNNQNMEEEGNEEDEDKCVQIMNIMLLFF